MSSCASSSGLAHVVQDLALCEFLPRDPFADVLPGRRGSGRPDLTCLYSLKKKTDGTNCELSLNQEELSVRNWRGHNNPEGFLDDRLVIAPEIGLLREAVSSPPFSAYKRTDLGYGIVISVGILRLNGGKGDYRQYRLYLRHGKRSVYVAFTGGQWYEFRRALGMEVFA